MERPCIAAATGGNVIVESSNMDVVKTIKKNIVLIIPGAIAVVAILLLIPSFMIRGKIKAKLEENAGIAREFASTLNSAVSAKQPEIAKKFHDMYQQDANEIEKLAKETTQRELLSYKIFPDTNETSSQIFNEFKREYNKRFANFVKELKALDAPTDNEIRKQAGAINITDIDNTSGKKGGDEKIVELICKSRGEEIPVYANPWVFSGYEFWDKWEFKGMDTAIRDCWYCQMAYWIHEDVISTINAVNAGSSSVSQSSVKRLMASRFSDGAKDAGLDMPVYVTETTGGICQPWTGRKCDDKMDVMHFSVSVIIKADDVLKFMKALCSEKEHDFSGFKGELPPEKSKHNQITILESSIQPIERDSVAHRRYYYGQDAVVQLDLNCEYVFNRQGYDVIKPKMVADEISGAAQPEGGSGSYDNNPQMRGFGPGPGMGGGMP